MKLIEVRRGYNNELKTSFEITDEEWERWQQMRLEPMKPWKLSLLDRFMRFLYRRLIHE